MIYKEQGADKEFWVDGASGFTYRHRPVIRKRGFVELLQDGEVVYILNIHEERFMPYHNWEIRADERICAIGNKLYFSEEKEEGSYRIKKRSDDFRMFVVEVRSSNQHQAMRSGQASLDTKGVSKAKKEGKVSTPSKTMAYDEFMIVNKAGKQLEITFRKSE